MEGVASLAGSEFEHAAVACCRECLGVDELSRFAAVSMAFSVHWMA